MPPQILIQNVEQFQALQNLGVILVISKSGLSICPCIIWKKRIMWRQHISAKRSYMADGIVTNTMAASDTLLGVAKFGFIIYELPLLSFTCGYIQLKNIMMSSNKSSSSYFITRQVIIGLVQIRVWNVTSWWTVKILKKIQHLLTSKVRFILSKISKLYICFVWNVFNDTMW